MMRATHCIECGPTVIRQMLEATMAAAAALKSIEEGTGSYRPGTWPNLLRTQFTYDDVCFRRIRSIWGRCSGRRTARPDTPQERDNCVVGKAEGGNATAAEALARRFCFGGT
jgi:hypothetical protein